MNSELDQIDEVVDQRIREEFSGLRDDVAASADVEGALAAARSESRRAVWSRTSVRVAAVAAAAVMTAVVGFATWPREVTVTTGGNTSRSVDPDPVTSTTPTPNVSITSVAPAMPGDRTQHLIVGGTRLETRPVGLPTNSTAGSRSPDGSGCSPRADVLPDGQWYGYLVVDHGRLAFDVACRFTNDAARWAIQHYEGRKPAYSENRFVLNESVSLRPLEVEDGPTIVDIADYKNEYLDDWQVVTAAQLTRRVEQLGYQNRLAAEVWVIDGRLASLYVSADNYAG